MIDELNALLDAIRARRVRARRGPDRRRPRLLRRLRSERRGAATPKAGIADWRPIIQRDFDIIMRFWHLSPPDHRRGAAAIASPPAASWRSPATSPSPPRAPSSASRSCGSAAASCALLMPWFVGPEEDQGMDLSPATTRSSAARGRGLGPRQSGGAGRPSTSKPALRLARDIAVNDRDEGRDGEAGASTAAIDIMGMLRCAGRWHGDRGPASRPWRRPEGRTFREIRIRKDGLKAALAWRDARFGGSESAVCRSLAAELP